MSSSMVQVGDPSQIKTPDGKVDPAALRQFQSGEINNATKHNKGDLTYDFALFTNPASNDVDWFPSLEHDEVA